MSFAGKHSVGSQPVSAQVETDRPDGVESQARPRSRLKARCGGAVLTANRLGLLGIGEPNRGALRYLLESVRSKIRQIRIGIVISISKIYRVVGDLLSLVIIS